MKIYVIGAGGVGSWLLPVLTRFYGPKLVIVVDGDSLEPKNLERQLFNDSHLGMNKAQALGELYGCDYVDTFFHSNTIGELGEYDWLIGCVDNHRARREILRACDLRECRAIIGANETVSSEAYFYTPDWQGTERDPRVYYPEIETDASGDPLAARIGCTGPQAADTPQLVTANFLAAGLIGHLLMIWDQEAVNLDDQAIEALPYKLFATLSRLGSVKVGAEIATTVSTTQ